jgi:hypothetical protein
MVIIIVLLQARRTGPIFDPNTKKELTTQVLLKGELDLEVGMI